MFSNDEAEHLIKLPKEISGDNTINLINERNRLSFIAPDAPEYSFILDLTLNKKIDFKLSIHHQEHTSFIGLLRIDYKGRHTNPQEAHDSLPSRFKQYVGKEFGIDEPHVHCYVAGYPPLAWALPVSTYGFPVLHVNSNGDIIKAVQSFANEINVKTPIDIQTSLL